MKGTIHGSGLITENFPPRLFVIELKSSKSHLQWVYYSLSDLGALNYQVLIQKLIYWSKRSIVKDLGLKEACDDKRKAGISASHCMYVSPKSLSVSYSYEGITDCIVLSPFFLLTRTI